MQYVNGDIYEGQWLEGSKFNLMELYNKIIGTAMERTLFATVLFILGNGLTIKRTDKGSLIIPMATAIRGISTMARNLAPAFIITPMAIAMRANEEMTNAMAPALCCLRMEKSTLANGSRAKNQEEALMNLLMAMFFYFFFYFFLFFFIFFYFFLFFFYFFLFFFIFFYFFLFFFIFFYFFLFFLFIFTFCCRFTKGTGPQGCDREKGAICGAMASSTLASGSRIK